MESRKPRKQCQLFGWAIHIMGTKFVALPLSQTNIRRVETSNRAGYVQPAAFANRGTKIVVSVIVFEHMGVRLMHGSFHFTNRTAAVRKPFSERNAVHAAKFASMLPARGAKIHSKELQILCFG